MDEERSHLFISTGSDRSLSQMLSTGASTSSACNKLKSDTVHAVAFASRRGTIVKHMTQMPTAATAMHFNSGHKKRLVYRYADRLFNWVKETRPKCVEAQR
jgi:hypothetical protein